MFLSWVLNNCRFQYCFFTITLRNVNISTSRTKERDWKPLTALEPKVSHCHQKKKNKGVLISHNLSWHNHIMAKVNTANKVLRLIKRTCGTCTKPHVLLKLYIHLVRPHVEFACRVWSPHQQFLIDLIERVQRRATKLIIKDRPSHFRNWIFFPWPQGGSLWT